MGLLSSIFMLFDWEDRDSCCFKRKMKSNTLFASNVKFIHRSSLPECILIVMLLQSFHDVTVWKEVCVKEKVWRNRPAAIFPPLGFSVSSNDNTATSSGDFVDCGARLPLLSVPVNYNSLHTVTGILRPSSSSLLVVGLPDKHDATRSNRSGSKYWDYI